MTKSEIYNRIKSVLSELLTPSDLSLIIDGAEQPIEQYLDELCPASVDEFYQSIPTRVLSPVDAGCVVIPPYNAIVVKKELFDYVSTTASFGDITRLSTPSAVLPEDLENYLIDEATFNEIFHLTADTVYNDRMCISGYYFRTSEDLEIYYVGSGLFMVDTEYKVLYSHSDTTYCFSFSKEGEQKDLSIISKHPYDINYALRDDELALPFTMLEIERMKYASWTYGPAVITIDDPAYDKQSNIYTRATYAKPVVALRKNLGKETVIDGITVDSRLFIAEIYSPKDEEDNLELCEITVKTPFVNIPADLITAFSYLVASRYLEAIGNAKAERAKQIYTEIIEKW